MSRVIPQIQAYGRWIEINETITKLLAEQRDLQVTWGESILDQMRSVDQLDLGRERRDESVLA